MYCRAEYGIKLAIGRVERLVGRLDGSVSKEFTSLAAAIERIETRLDAIEQAIVDPQGEAAQEIRDRHGLSKPAKPTELKGVGQKNG